MLQKGIAPCGRSMEKILSRMCPRSRSTTSASPRVTPHTEVCPRGGRAGGSAPRVIGDGKLKPTGPEPLNTTCEQSHVGNYRSRAAKDRFGFAKLRAYTEFISCNPGCSA